MRQFSWSTEFPLVTLACEDNVKYIEENIEQNWFKNVYLFEYEVSE